MSGLLKGLLIKFGLEKALEIWKGKRVPVVQSKIEKLKEKLERLKGLR